MVELHCHPFCAILDSKDRESLWKIMLTDDVPVKLINPIEPDETGIKLLTLPSAKNPVTTN